MNDGGERTEASAVMTEILLSPICGAAGFSVSLQNSLPALPRFNLHQRFLYPKEARLILKRHRLLSELIHSSNSDYVVAR